MNTMEEIPITYNPEKTARIYGRYYRYGRNKVIKHEAIIVTGIIGVVVTAIGLVLDGNFPIYFGLIVVGLVLAWVIYSIVIFRVRINKLLKRYEKYYGHENYQFIFAFGDSGFTYKLEDAFVEYKWAHVNNYIIHEGEAYLYNKQGDIMEIISSDIMGPDKFERFINLLKSNHEQSKESL